MTKLPDYLFYSEPGITLYCGDCREVLPLVEDVGSVVSDPPYGISYVHGPALSPWASRHNGIPVIGDNSPFDPKHILDYKHIILWGGNHYADRLPPSPGWLVWDKRCNTGGNDQSDCEIAWSNVTTTARIFYHLWKGWSKDSERGVRREHPTQKPVVLMSWCLSFIPSDITVADPYCGTGPLLEAAKLLGRRAIGIELEPKYCEIAVKRLRQEVLTF